MTDSLVYWLHNQGIFNMYINNKNMLEEGDPDDKNMARKYLLNVDMKYTAHLENKLFEAYKYMYIGIATFIVMSVVELLWMINM